MTRLSRTKRTYICILTFPFTQDGRTLVMFSNKKDNILNLGLLTSASAFARRRLKYSKGSEI